MNRLPTIAAVLMLAGCATTPSPQTTVAGAEEALTAADQVATVYAGLPQCPATDGTDGLTCSQAKTIVVIKADAQTAHDAVKAAEIVAAGGGAPDLTTATAALAALQAAFPAAATTSK
jgi:hypothetical protein